MKRILMVLLLSVNVWAQSPKVVQTRLFEVSVPSTWEERITDAALYLLYPTRDSADPQDANVSISPTTISGGMSMDAFTFMGKHEIETNYPEVGLTVSTPTKLGTLAAHRFEYKGPRNGKKYLVVQVMAIDGKNAYTVTFVGTEADFNSVRNPFEQMLRNFKTIRK